METIYDEYLRKYKKSLLRLNYSFEKVKKIDLNKSLYSDEELEILESFASRFARSSDYFLSKIVRARVLMEDPAFRGTLKAHLSELIKINYIKSIDEWMNIRELRNRISHEYTEEDLPKLIVALTLSINLLFESEKTI